LLTAATVKYDALAAGRRDDEADDGLYPLQGENIRGTTRPLEDLCFTRHNAVGSRIN